MIMKKVTYNLLYAHWFEYDAYRKEFPFVSDFMPDNFKNWALHNKILIDGMLKARTALLTRYVKIDPVEGQWMHEHIGNGMHQYILKDETQRLEFNLAFKEWENKEVTITI